MSTSQRAVERVTPAAAIPAPATQTTAVEQARAVAEVAAAVQVAQQNPRDMNRAWAEMKAACGRTGLASRAFYAVRNRGNGPSVHLARELARIWGNVDYGVHELHRDDTRGMSEIRAYAWDQQTNVRSSRTFQVPHQRMANGQRKPLTDLQDVYLNNQNIGARAVREAIFTVLPADFVAEAQDICRQTIEKGDGKPLPDRIADMVAAFAGIGVRVPQIETRLGRKKGQWSAADVADMSVVFSSIKRGELSADEEFLSRVTADEIAAQAAARPAAVEQPEAPSGGGPGPSVAQRGMLMGLFTKVGVEDRDARLRITSTLVGRKVGSSNELTRAETSDLINILVDASKASDPGAVLAEAMAAAAAAGEGQ